MTPSELGRLTLAEAARQIRDGDLSSVELTRAVLGRAEALDPSMKAFITRAPERALASAAQRDEARIQGRVAGPLHGVPIAMKDLIDVRGIPTTGGSAFFRDRVPESNAVIVDRLEQAGAVIVGKTNLHEFAFGVTNENPHYGAVRNPWDRERISGGSSGGSAVAVSMSMAIGAIGTDTGGSIRIPAALTGTVGLKPTYGRVPLSGVIPLAPTLDTAGPMTRTVEDAAILLGVIADGNCTFQADIASGVQGFDIGVPRKAYWNGVQDEVGEAVEKALSVLAKLGARVVDVEVPDPRPHEDMFRVIATSEAYLFHRDRLESEPGRFGDDVRRRLLPGKGMLAVDFIAAERARERLRADIDPIFRQVDVLGFPTLPVTAPRIGQTTFEWDDDSEPVLRALTRNTRLASLTGLPAISVPCGFVEGLPVGLQILGPAGAESRIVRVAGAYERETTWIRSPE